MSITYNIRELQEEDLEKGFLETLTFLTKVGKVPSEKLLDTFHRIKESPDYRIFVAVTDDERVVGAMTLSIEQKFVHECGKVGHIEDVATHRDFQKQGIASSLMEKVIEAAKEARCYKIILDCKEDLIPFYERFGFKKHEIQMRLDLK